MNLQTKISLSKQLHNLIGYESKILLLGSCFSENIGEKFDYLKFQTSINPFGILFHPLAIETLITRSINKDFYLKDELILNNEIYSCFDAHSRLNSLSKENILKGLNASIEHTYQQIHEASHVIITLGTAWVYRHIATDKIVANCHKVPQRQFLKELLSIEKITESLEAIVSLVKSVNPNANLIFTVSPVRHLKDGFVENTRSKSYLISAIHQLVDARKQLYYFPSYEIMLDELRDYRFYSADMLHPNHLAVEYIWNKFKDVWISERSFDTLKKVTSIQTRKLHKPFNPSSESHIKFLNQLKLDIEALKERYPFMDF
ncbi:MAG: GSCFA domain-containing protein [Winogradskyella sp.]|uniref:GSCFA domain-containing protein n=1 Tax=Winogradskyella sp. TaxID=1883156 RepID=UPI0025D8B94F|nr:GSCFA domain-containing protein [Winogradskyella sp.]NRB61056.1 GSCFA domain-containing protein [Winogradskyella sp.]